MREGPIDAARAKVQARALNKEKLLARRRAEEADGEPHRNQAALASALDVPIFHRYDRP